MSRGIGEVGRNIGGRYVLEALLGTGGMGEVWRARHIALESKVAIKFLHGGLAQRGSTRRRFLTEAQVTARLRTRNAVQVFDFGVTDDGEPYLVMELLEGETLGHRIERCGRIAPARVVRVLGRAARALDRAHALGIVHRDFKPDNIVICSDEEGESVKVLDFGIAKLLSDLVTTDPSGDSSGDVSQFDSSDDVSQFDSSDDVSAEDEEPPRSLSRTGNIMGTPFYMAPEQVRHAPNLDLRADLWAFGVVAYECLTGRVPFRGATIIELFEHILRGERAKAEELAHPLPGRFLPWFEKACALEPDDRFASAGEAAEALASALAGLHALQTEELPPRRKSGPVVVGAVDAGEGIAPTLEVSESVAQVLCRARSGDGFQTLGAVPGAMLAEGLPTNRTMETFRSPLDALPRTPGPMTAPTITRTTKPRGRRAWLLLSSTAIFVFLALGAWRLSAARAPAASTSAPSGATNRPEAPRAPSATPVAAAASPPAQSGPAASESPPNEPASSSARTARSPASPASPRPKPAASTGAARAATSADAPPSPSSAATAPHTSSPPTKRRLGDIDPNDPFGAPQ